MPDGDIQKAGILPQRDTPPRRFLFLQGPLGPFFKIIGRELRARGHSVTRVNFNGGDLFDWPGQGTICYKGRHEDFSAWVTDYAAKHDITDLVLIGDCRPLHVAAMAALKAWRPEIRAHVFEEGYLRPDYITLEFDGVNARSRLPRDPQVILQAPEAAVMQPLPAQIFSQNIAMGAHAFVSYLAMFLLGWLFPHHQHHRPLGPFGEMQIWFKRLVTRPWRKERALAIEAKLMGGKPRFFLALIQLNVDKQVLFHSPFKSIRQFLATTIESFAAHAPADCLLVIKGHPLDNGKTPHAADIAELAKAAGVTDRVIFIDGGNLPELVNASLGAVTINSTAGISALHRSVPLITLGRAVYNMAGLTHQDGLDRFWTDPAVPDRDLYQAWRRVITARSQINGGFYSKQGMTVALPAVIHYLETARLPA